MEFFLSIISVSLAIEVGGNLWGISELQQLYPHEWPKVLAFASVLSLGNASLGLYHRRFRFGHAGMVMRLALSMSIGAITMTLLYYFAPPLFLGRRILVLSFIFTFLFMSVTRVLFIKSLDRDTLRRKILVLGAGEKAALIPQYMRRRVDTQGFQIVGYVHVRGEHDVVEEEKIIRPDITLLALAQNLQADEIVVAVAERRRKGFPVHDLLDCKLSGIDVIDLQGFFEREMGKVKLDILSPSWLIFSDGFNQSDSKDLAKRTFDLFVSILLLTVFSPLMLVIASVIFIEGGFNKPILYRQIRIGQHWKLFNMYKFRSMIEDAEEDGKARWAEENDHRVTRIGKFLRKYRLDELPQIFNVLKGDMSFVGPRPERPEFVTRLTEEIPYFAERHRMKPGITGWAQLCYPYGASDKDASAKLEYDLFYVKNNSIFLDIIILLQTAEVVLLKKGGR